MEQELTPAERLMQVNDQVHQRNMAEITRLKKNILFHPENAVKLLNLIRNEEDQTIYYIFWIRNSKGKVLQHGITTHKRDGENMLAGIQNQVHDAVIEWQGPVKYYDGRKRLEGK